MDFRWIALLAIWTILIGPVVNPPRGGQRPAGASASGTTAQSGSAAPLP